MNIAFYTLGCKVNQFETQALELILSQKGHTVTRNLSDADIIVVNTCTVTSTSDQKSRRAIRHFIKEYPDAKIAVCGCLSQVNKGSVEAIEGVSLISGTSDKQSFADAIDSLSKNIENELILDNPLSRREFELLPSGRLLGHTRAMLKIEDGCSNFCTYCIIPYSRGPVRSMPLEAAIKECEKLAREGFREVVITGIEISSYGRDLNPQLALSDIVKELCERFPDIRIRLGSIEPRSITPEFCDALKGFSNLCPHFHLSMQSGCDETLVRMKRRYLTDRFYESVSLLRENFPGCAITTDMIVGFPGETEEEFSKTLSFVEKCAFSSMHIFPYSRRTGTPAAKMDGQITRSEKAARAKRAQALSKKLTSAYLLSRIDKKEAVLFEEEVNGFWVGHATNYAKVYVKSGENLKNRVLQVGIKGIYSDGLLGEII